MDGRLVAPVDRRELMAAAIREFRAAESQFNQAGPEAFEATNSALTAARDRIALIAGRRPERRFVLPWLRRGRLPA